MEVRKSGILRTIPLLITICLFSFPAYAQYSGGSEAAKGISGNVRGETGVIQIWSFRDDEAGDCYDAAMWKVA